MVGKMFLPDTTLFKLVIHAVHTQSFVSLNRSTIKFKSEMLATAIKFNFIMFLKGSNLRLLNYSHLLSHAAAITYC